MGYLADSDVALAVKGYSHVADNSLAHHAGQAIGYAGGNLLRRI